MKNKVLAMLIYTFLILFSLTLFADPGPEAGVDQAPDQIPAEKKELTEKTDSSPEAKDVSDDDFKKMLEKTTQPEQAQPTGAIVPVPVEPAPAVQPAPVPAGQSDPALLSAPAAEPQATAATAKPLATPAGEPQAEPDQREVSPPADQGPESAEKKQEEVQNEAKAEEKQEHAAEAKKFVKGELANIGASYIVSPYNSLGLGMGVTSIDAVWYLTLDPRFVYNSNSFDLLLSLHLPFNIEIINLRDPGNQSNQWQLRKEDWNNWQAYFRIIEYIQYGRSEDNLFFSMGSNFSQTIGHGTIMKRYIPTLDTNPVPEESVKFNYYNDYGGFELIIGDLTAANMFGGLVFLKPLSWFGLDDYRSKSLSFGYSFAMDRTMPSQLGYVEYVDMPDPYGPDWPPNVPRRIASTPDNPYEPLVLSTRVIYLQGIDVEFKFFKDDYSDIKGFFDYSFFNDTIARGGATFGLLGRFNVDDAKKHAIRAQVEGRVYRDDYLPSYFDMFYSIERYELVTNIFGQKNFRPDGLGKYQNLLQDSRGNWVGSFYFDFTYSYRDYLSVMLGYEQLPKSASIYFHLELPDLWIFKGMFDFAQRGITSGQSMFKDSAISTFMRGVVRIGIWPKIINLNAYIGKQWAFWPEARPRSDGLQGGYVSAWNWGCDLEVGYEWGHKKQQEY